MNDIIPVALFAYARPEHLKQTLDGLQINNVPIIYAFCDGSKDETDIVKVKEVRKLIKEITWAKTKVIERSKNLGLGNSIRSGISEVLLEYDKVIVVEDDIVFRPGAYSYVVEALNHYENNKKIMTVSMWTHRDITLSMNNNGFFSKRFICWGWGTYRWAWQLYDGSPEEMYSKCISKNIKPLEWGDDILWQVQNAKSKNLWYVGFALTHFLHDKLSYFPNLTLCDNIGFDGSGSNSGSKKYITDGKEKVTDFPKSFPEPFLDIRLQKKFQKFFKIRKKTSFFLLRKKAINIIKHLNIFQ